VSVPLHATPPAAIGGLAGTDTTAIQTTVPRQVAASSYTLPSGTMALAYFRSTRTQTVSSLRTQTRSTAAAGLTLARMGLYEVSNEATGDGTLIAATVNDLTLWTAAFSFYSRAVQQPAQMQAGRLYGFAALAVGTTGPNLYAAGSWAWDSEAPRTSATKGGLANLPATLASVGGNGFAILGGVQP
jgi:hypothetical protein